MNPLIHMQLVTFDMHQVDSGWPTDVKVANL